MPDVFPPPGGPAPALPGAPRLKASWVAWAVALATLASAAAVAWGGFNVRTLGAVLGRIPAGVALGAAALFALRLWLGALRLRHLSEAHLPPGAALRAQLAWEFFSFVAPPALGGGPFVVVTLAEDSPLSPGEAAATMLSAIFYEQVWTTLGIGAVLALAWAGVPVFPVEMPAWGLLPLVGYLVGSAAWTAFLLVALFLRPSWLATAARGLGSLPGLRRRRARLDAHAETLRERSRHLAHRSIGFHATALALTATAWLVRYGVFVVLLAALVPGLDAGLAFLRQHALTVAAFAVPTPGSAGGAEALYALFYAPPLVPAALVVPTLLLWRFLNAYAFLPLGLYVAWRSARR